MSQPCGRLDQLQEHHKKMSYSMWRIKKYNLIETVATDAARICVARYGVTTVKVTVEKPNALRFAESSSVTIERCWEDFKWHD